MILRERVFDVIAERASIDRSSLDEASPIAELSIDSLAFMALIMQLEEAESVFLNDAEIDRVLTATTLGELVNIIDNAKAHTDIAGKRILP